MKQKQRKFLRTFGGEKAVRNGERSLAERLLHNFLTKRWANTPEIVLDNKNGSIPISIKRVTALAAVLVWSVAKTKCPVKAAWIAIWAFFATANVWCHECKTDQSCTPGSRNNVIRYRFFSTAVDHLLVWSAHKRCGDWSTFTVQFFKARGLSDSFLRWSE